MLKCPHRPDCDGCPHFELDSATSTTRRLAALHLDMKAYAARYGWPLPEEIAAPSAREGWRNRARMVVDDEGRLGFYRAGSRDHLPISGCLIHAPFLEEVLEHLRSFDGLERARFIDVRVAPWVRKAILTAALDEMDEAWNEALRAHLEQRYPAEDVGVQVNVGGGDAVLGGEQHVISGAPALQMQVGPLELEVPPQAFFQTNLATLEAIHGFAKGALEGVEVVLDAFCGVGVHGLALAPESAVIYGYDSEPTAIEAARRNAERAGRQATFLVASDDAGIDELPEGKRAVIVNPARAGLSDGTSEKLAALQPEAIVYVSCSATTFLRDAERLALSGYALTELQIFDMMPRTEHIELVGIFKPAASPEVERARDEDDARAGQTIWLALLEGEVPKRGRLPGGKIEVERLRKSKNGSVCRLYAPHGTTEDELRSTCRRWKHAVVADPQFGASATTHRMLREHGLDRIALHRLADAERIRLVPAHLVSIFRLPETLLNEVK